MSMYDVSVVKCDEYKADGARAALTEAIDAVGGLGWIEKGMKIVIKATVETVCIVNGRLSASSLLDQKFESYLNAQ